MLQFMLYFLGVLLKLLQVTVTNVVNYFNGERPASIPPVKNVLLNLSATTLARKIRSKEISSQDVVRAYIERIKEVNPILNAVIDERYDAALKEAMLCDENIRSGKVSTLELEKTKPLYGVPFTVKESCSLKDLSYTAGTVIRRGVKATSDGEAVKLLRQAGGIPLCVTNTPELCLSFDTSNFLIGRTKNPYDTRYTPGGSSGGEGAILGSGSSVLGLGSDIAGSIRLPAHFNGIFGHKPTPGIITTKGHYPNSDDPQFSKFLVVGPMTRYAEDLHLAMKVLAAKCNRDLHLNEPVDLKKLKIFYLEDMGRSICLTSTTSEIRSCIKRATMHLEDQGCMVKEYPMGSLLHILDIATFNYFSIKKLPQLLMDPKNPKHEKGLISELPKILLGLTEYTKSLVFMKSLLEVKSIISESTLSELQSKTNQIHKHFLELLGNNGVFIYPTFPTATVVGKTILLQLMNSTYCTLCNILGFPSTHVPMGLNKDGLPIGFQVIAAPYQDRLCLAVAKELEKTFGGWIPPYSS